MQAQRWGNLKLVKEYCPPIMHKRLDGSEYDSGNFGPPMWLLRCDCGYEFSIFKEDFPGRRKLRDCQRPECPICQEQLHRSEERTRPRRAEIGRPRSPVFSIPVSTYIPLPVANEIDSLARKFKLSRSGLIAEMLKAQVLILRDEYDGQVKN